MNLGGVALNTKHGCFQKVKDEMKEIYGCRNILKSLVVKNLVGRYKSSVLGLLWHFITPIITMIIYCIVFTQIRAGPISNFWVFITSALFPFIFMTTNLTSGAGCIVSNSSIIKKMYVPKEILVFSQILSSLIVMLVGYTIVLLIAATIGNGISISWTMILPVILLMTIFVTGYVFLFSALTVYIRDVQYLLSSLSIVYYFLTPMYFIPDTVSGALSTIIWFNPFTYFVECFHSIVYFNTFPNLNHLLMCLLLSILSLIVGKTVFNKLKKGFVERL